MDNELVQRVNDLEDQMLNHTHSGVDATSELNDTVFINYALRDTEAKFANYYVPFFIATRPCVVKAVSMSYKTAAGFTATGFIEKLTSTQTSGSGVKLNNGINLNSTVETPYRDTIISQSSLNTGDRLGFTTTGSPTNLNTLIITVELLV